MIVETRSAAETGALGRRLGEACGKGELLTLTGDLGSGKTCFVKGLAQGLGIEADAVTSPTFVLMNLHEGRLRLAHYDLYRLDSVDLAALGFYELRDEGVSVVEWADQVDEKHWGDALGVAFEVTGEETRRLMFRARGPRSEALLGRLNLSPPSTLV
jgi:tRNA threonylcarbamoyladenosine biosynthesis protein TsaE